MSEQTEVQRLIQHMDDEWPEDWDGNAIRAELLRLHDLNAELLESLKHVTGKCMWGDERSCSGAIFDARAVIAKAEGK